MSGAPPHDLTAETNVIGAAVASNYPRPTLDSDDFYHPAHRRLWAALTTLTPPVRPADLPPDLIDIARRAARAWVPPPERHAGHVRRHAAARRLIAVGDAIADLGWRHDDPLRAIEIAYQLLDAVALKATTQPDTPSRQMVG